MTFFVYGTLMDDAVVRQVTGRVFQREAAVLRGYRRVQPARGYPYIVSDAQAEVHGVALRDVDSAALLAFDRYEDEGHLYQRTEVTVMVGQAQERALTYVGVPDALRG